MSATTERKGDYILTYSGLHFWPLDPRAEEVDIRDIAHSLALQCRFTGHTRTFYSVAEHSVRVSLIVPDRFALLALLHDAAEAYLTDLPLPLKRCRELEAYQYAEFLVYTTISAALIVPNVPRDLPISACLECVHEADRRLLATEFRDLMPAGGTDRSLVGVEPLSDTIHPWDWTMAETMFLDRFRELTQ